MAQGKGAEDAMKLADMVVIVDLSIGQVSKKSEKN
jgi:hypothetical protein